MSRRTERVASLIRTVLADAIQSRLSDPRIEPLTSITRVEVSADFAVARVYVSVMAEGERRKLSVAALRHAAGRLRSMVAHEVALRQVPQLDFQLDESVRRSFETVQQLDRMMEELGEQPACGEEPRASTRADATDQANDTADSEHLAAGEPSAEEKTCRGGGAGGVSERREDT